MSRENIYKIKIFGIYTGVTLITILLFKYMLPVVAPFVIALIIAALIERPVTFLEKKFRLKRTIGAILMMLIIFIIIGVSVFWGGKVIIRQINNLVSQYNSYISRFSTMASECCEKVDGALSLKNGTSFAYLSAQTQKAVTKISDTAMDSVMNRSVNMIAGFTMIFTIFAITIMGTLFLSKDMNHIKKRVRDNIFGSEAVYIWGRLKEVLGTYFKTELIIMALTCAICTLGLFLMKNPYAFLLGILIGLVDALPILGTGTVFIPWAIILVLLKDYRKAVFIFILYIICYYEREFLEPKLMGNKLGVSPVMMLLSIYAGLKLFGISGVFTGPVALILIKELAGMIINNL